MARPRVEEDEMSPPWLVLTPAIVQQIDEKLAEALEMASAEVVLVAKRGRLRWIRGPTPSEPIRES